MAASFYILCILSAFLISLLSMPLVIKMAYFVGAIDQPDERKVHAQAMPRLGGLSIFLAFILCMLFLVDLSRPMQGVVYGATIMFIVGVVDDICALTAKVKLLGQIAAAGIAIYYGVVVQFITNPFNGLLDLGLFSIPLTLLWIVGITNAINLIDGLDGLAGGVSAIAAATMGIVAFRQGQIEVALTAFIVVAAIGGFLPFNFYPARIFMGDSGSNFLGFILGCLAIMGTAKSAALISLFVPIVILGIPIFDTFFAIIRRINNRVPIFSPDKDHLHHRLMAMGMSHRRSVVIIYGISAFFAAIAVTMTVISSPKGTLVLAILLLLIVLGADKIGLVTGASGGRKTRRIKSGATRNVEL